MRAFADVAPRRRARLVLLSGRGEEEAQPVSVAEYAAAAVDHGVPPEFVGFLTYLFTEVFGHNATTADGIARALGRPPHGFAAYTRDAAATGAWALEAVS